MQVHDELVLEVPDDEIALMKNALPELYEPMYCNWMLPLLIEVGVGNNWEQAH
jgi:DNA polymerase-1